MRISDWSSEVCSSDHYVCSVDPSIRCGLRRLKDDGAPPFFPAIGRQFLNRQRGATPEKIVTPIAAGAVAARSLIRHTPNRRSDETRVGKGGVSPCNSRRYTDQEKKKTNSYNKTTS